MSENWAAFVEDSRTVCKYGIKCYQKNPEHHKQYKHPPAKKRNSPLKKPEKKRFKPSLNTDEPQTDDSTASHIQDVNCSGTDTVGDTTQQAVEDDSKSDSVSQKSDEELAEEPTPETIQLPDQISHHSTNTDPNLFKELFLVKMPQDFFQFYKCLQEVKDFEKLLASVNLLLIGPFDLLLGKLPVLEDKDLYLIHWRFFYDPPEFQAVLKRKGNSEYHIGYFRDSPDEDPVFLASNDSAKDCHLTPVADNIFAAVYLYLEKEKKSSPFISMSCQKLMEKVKKWAEEHKYSLEPYNMRKRLAQTVTKSLHGAGIAVPYDKKTELGYRKLAETDANLKKLFKNLSECRSRRAKDALLSELQPVITFANIAVDECDFGTGLEAGIDLFCSGLRELQQSATSCLVSAYSLLKRDAFAKIIQAHMKYRRKGPNMSVLSTNQ